MDTDNQKFLDVFHGMLADMVDEYIEKGLLNKGDKPLRDEPFSFFVDPYDFTVLGAGKWKERRSAITFDTLRQVSKQNPVVAAIVNTRVNQVASFSVPARLIEQTGTSSLGYKIVHRDKAKELSESERNFIMELEDFIWRCGQSDPKTIYDRDNFDQWLRKTARDSLVFDAACSEIVPTRKNSIYEFHAIDASTIRFAKIRQRMDDEDKTAFVQLMNGQIMAEFTPDELMYGIRNPTTDIRNCGYGISEIEQLVSVITSIFNAIAHNAMFFTKGAAVKGLLNFRPATTGGGANREQFEAFKRAFQAMITGSQNAWKMPITQAEHVEFVNMGGTNREFEFSRYLDFLVKLTCFPAGTQVTMADGTRKNIEDVQIGDEVITHKGRVRRVTQTSKRPYSGEMIRAKGAFSVNVLSTPNHPFYTCATATRRDYYKRVVDRMVAPPGWKDAGDLRHESSVGRERLKTQSPRVFVDDYFFAPRLEEQGKPWILTTRMSFSGTSNGGVDNKEFVVDERLARFLGLYVAEGWSQPKNSKVTLSFGADENELIEFSRAVLQEYFDLETTVRDFSDRGCRQVVAGSRFLAETLIDLFGSISTVKHLPRELFEASATVKLAFIKGLIDGDGGILYDPKRNYAGGVALTTGSKILAEQVSLLALGCLGPTNVVKTKRSAGYSTSSDNESCFYRVVFNRHLIGLFQDLCGSKGEKARNAVAATSGKTSIRTSHAVDGGWALLSRSFTREDFSGFVYNLEVEEDHSYLVNGFVAVHNCAVFLIDPAEVNFYMAAGSGNSAPMFESNQEAKLKMSRDKGLRPLLQAVSNWINQFIVARIAPEFYFCWAGLDQKSEKELLELRRLQVEAYRTVDEVRKDAGDDELGAEKGGDIICNPQWVQMMNNRAMMASMGGGGGDEGQEGEEQPGEQEEQPGEQEEQPGEQEEQPEGQPKFPGEPEEDEETQKSLILPRKDKYLTIYLEE